MRQKAPKNWRSWCVTTGGTESTAQDLPLPRGNLELPAADGIRWGLVRRIQAEIAAGTYDTEERLAAAEERFLAMYS